MGKQQTGNRLLDGIPTEGAIGIVAEPPEGGGTSTGNEGTVGKTAEEIAEEARVAAETAEAARIATEGGDPPAPTGEEQAIIDVEAKEADQRTEDESTLLEKHYDTKATTIGEKVETDRTPEETQFLVDYNEALLQQSTVYKFGQRYGIGDKIEDTEEGLFSLGDKVREAALTEGVNTFLDQTPMMKEFYDHLNAGRSVDTFKKKYEVNQYADITIKDDDPEQHEKVYRESLQVKGMGLEEIDDLVESAKASDKLLERSKTGLEYMKTRQEDAVNVELANEGARLQAAAAREEALGKEVDTLIKGGKLMDHVIPQNEIRAFDEYLNKPAVKLQDGRTITQVAYDWSRLTTEQNLFLDRIVQLGFKMKGIGGTAIKLGDKKSIKFGEGKIKTPGLGGEGGGFPATTGTPSFIRDGGLRGALQQSGTK